MKHLHFKYVMYEDNAFVLALVTVNHTAMQLVGHGDLVSAGFLDMYVSDTGVELIVGGSSAGLGIKSRAEDTQIFKDKFGIKGE